MQSELEQSRAASYRLLDALAGKIGATRGAARNAAHYVQVHSVKDMATGIERVVRRRPASSIALAVVAGYLFGCVLRGDRQSR